MVEEVEKVPGLFDFIESVTNHKHDLMTSDACEKAYDPFMVNRALAMGKDTVLLASIMNMSPNNDKFMQYQFYLQSIPKKKRYNKWAKKTPISPDIEVIARYFKVNMTVAGTYRKLINEDQMERIREVVKGGGAEKKQAQRGKRNAK